MGTESTSGVQGQCPWGSGAKPPETVSITVYISPICPEDPRERIFTKFGVTGCLADVINCDKFCDNLLRGFDFTGDESSNFSYRKLTSLL